MSRQVAQGRGRFRAMATPDNLSAGSPSLGDRHGLPQPKGAYMTSIQHFANQHRLRIKRDELGELMIPGRLGHLYEHDSSILGLMLASPNGDDPRLDNTLRARMRKALREGLELQQRGDYESTFTFNPENTQHAELAIGLVGAKRKRRAKLSHNFLAARKRSQFKSRTVQEAPESPQTEPVPGLVGVM